MGSIHWVERKEISEEKWEKCLASHPSTASVFGQTWYLDACATFWSALVYEDYQAVLPICWRKKWGLYYVYPPFFLIHCGIIGNMSEIPPVSAWLRAIPFKFCYVELVFNSENHIPDYSNIKQITNQLFLLDCNKPYETLYKAYSHSHKRNLKIANSFSLQVSDVYDDKAVIQMFKATRGRDKNVNFQEADYELLLRLLQLLRSHNALESWAVTDERGEMCAAAFFPKMYGKYTFLFSGRSQESQKNRAMFYLIDRFIQHHAGEDCVVDFSTNNPMIARFYRDFGAERQTYEQLFIPLWIRLFLKKQ